MNKNLSLGLLIFSLFFAMQFAYCEDSFDMGSSSDNANTKMDFPVSNDIQEAKPNNEEQKKGFFSKLKSKKAKKQKQQKTKKNKSEALAQGYYGTLPNIGQDFAYKKAQPPINASSADSYSAPEKLEEKNLKPAPNDALFLDVIVKKEKESDYINDVQRTKFALGNLKKCIEEKGDIQRFNGCVNMVDLYSKNLQKKYENKSDSLRESYIDILNTNYHAKILGNLLYDSNYYARYIPTSTGKYSKENIEKQKQDLLKRINKTLFLIANET